MKSSSLPLVKPTLSSIRSTGYYRRKHYVSNVMIHSVLMIISILFVLPFILIISGSFSDDKTIYKDGYSLWPQKFSITAYQYILNDPSQIMNAYLVTISITLIGTGVGLLIMTMVSYALIRKEFLLRRWVTFYIFFTMLFSGGLVPSYILITQYLHIQNTLLVLIYPALMVPWYVLLLRTYFASLPKELIDAAKIDGASEWRILFQIIVPLSRPALATVALFSMLGYWNDWFSALLYIDDQRLIPLQFLLYKISADINFAAKYPQVRGIPIPTLSAQMAMAVLAVGPIVFVFLFLQKYFVRGITLGGLKGD